MSLFRVLERRAGAPDKVLHSFDSGGVAWTVAQDQHRRAEDGLRGPCQIVVLDPAGRERAVLHVRDPAICPYCGLPWTSVRHRKECGAEIPDPSQRSRKSKKMAARKESR